MPYQPVCCCGAVITCEDLDLPISYVDKNVIGGDGSGDSWVNARITIQSAVIADGLTHRIWIKGHGAGDPYNVTPVTGTGLTLIGKPINGDTWASFGFGAVAFGVASSCLVSLSAVSGTLSAFAGGNNIYDDCHSSGPLLGFDNQVTGTTNIHNNCTATGNSGGFISSAPGANNFYNNCRASGCIGNGFSVGGSSLGEAVGCIATACRDGFFTFTSFPVSDSLASGCTRHGYVRCTCTDCDAQNNALCGYDPTTVLVSGNSASGNGGSCAGITYCDGVTNPCGLCGECTP